jgi:Bacterial EndoU nuclease
MKSHSLTSRGISSLLAILLPAQITLSCAPPARTFEPPSHVLGRSDLDLDRSTSDNSTDTSPGEGWADGGSGNQEAKDWVGQFGPEYAPGYRVEKDYIPGIGLVDVFVPLDDAGLKVSASPPEKKGEPPEIRITLGKTSDPDKKDDDKSRPSFPLNPSKLKSSEDVRGDVQKRLGEREKEAKSREGKLGDQLAASREKKEKEKKGQLGDAVDNAKQDHSQKADDIGNSLQQVAGNTPPSDTPSSANDLPGPRGEQIAQDRARAAAVAADPKNPFSTDFAAAANTLLDEATTHVRNGNTAKADEERKQADKLITLGSLPPESLPPKRPIGRPAGPLSSPSEKRGEAANVGLSLYDAAASLSKSGLADAASKARQAASIAIDVAIGVARFDALFDLPFSVMEAFAGVTLEAGPDGSVGFRESTNLEKAFAFAALGAAGVAFAAGGWSAVVGAGVVGGLSKAMGKGLGRRLALREAEAAAEAAAKRAGAVVSAADNLGVKTASDLEKLGVNLASPKRKDHILYGDITGGGHLHPGKSGKTVFPPEWSAEKVMTSISDIVTNPGVPWEVNKINPKSGLQRYSAVGEVDGVKIRVIVEPLGEGIVTAWPISGPGVVKNP